LEDGLTPQSPRHGFEFVTGADREKQMVSGDPGAADWTVVLRGIGGSEVPASKLPPGSSLSPWRQMGPGEAAWDVDRYNLPHGEEVAAVLIDVPGEERPIDAGGAVRVGATAVVPRGIVPDPDWFAARDAGAMPTVGAVEGGQLCR
jgi:hypothetical protein